MKFGATTIPPSGLAGIFRKVDLFPQASIFALWTSTYDLSPPAIFRDSAAASRLQCFREGLAVCQACTSQGKTW